MAMYALYISYNKINLKRNPNYEIEENQNPKKIQMQKKSYYEIEENYNPHLSISQLLKNL
jgi:hypothetical protein